MKKINIHLKLAIIAFILFSCRHGVNDPSYEVIQKESVFTSAPFRQCHASTIAGSSNKLICAFFAGTEEKNPDVGIWLCINDGNGWSAPVEVVNGIVNDSTRYPCWNPVLFQVEGGPLLLFYKTGPDPVEWWGMLMRSADGGTSWSNPERLPDGILGPIKNKPVMLDDGTLVCPSSIEGEGWTVCMEITHDTCKTWQRSEISSSDESFDAIQPAVLVHGRKGLQILCRSKENVIVESWSYDNGITWAPLQATSLPNPNSGIDAVTLSGGRHMLVYNPTIVPEGRWTGDRTPLSVAVSGDGKTWKDILTLESDPGEYSYPAVIETSDGMIHIVYTWNRETIKHVILREKK